MRCLMYSSSETGLNVIHFLISCKGRSSELSIRQLIRGQEMAATSPDYVF